MFIPLRSSGRLVQIVEGPGRFTGGLTMLTHSLRLLHPEFPSPSQPDDDADLPIFLICDETKSSNHADFRLPECRTAGG